MIPVNTAFDTLVDADITVTPPLVSPNSLHGIWIQQFLEHSKWSRETLDSEIKKALKDITPHTILKNLVEIMQCMKLEQSFPLAIKQDLHSF